MSFEFLSIETMQALAQQYGYWSVFIGICLENMGIPLPGETLTVLGGFLAGSGELHYGWVLCGAIAGGVLGNNVGYWFGKWGGMPLIRRVAHLFRISDERIDATRAQFLQNAPKAVFFGRFVTFLRIFAAPLAGLVDMPYPLFFVCNLAGAVVWALVTVTVPFFLGQVMSLTEVVHLMTRFGAIALILISAAIIIPIWLDTRSPQQNPEE